jgi:hypothetical protein
MNKLNFPRSSDKQKSSDKQNPLGKINPHIKHIIENAHKGEKVKKHIDQFYTAQFINDVFS